MKHVFLLGLTLVSGSASAAEITQHKTFDRSYNVEGPPWEDLSVVYNNFFRTFDPSLGILTSVNLKVERDGYISQESYVISFEGDDHFNLTANADFGTDIVLQTGNYFQLRFSGTKNVSYSGYGPYRVRFDYRDAVELDIYDQESLSLFTTDLANGLGPITFMAFYQPTLSVSVEYSSGFYAPLSYLNETFDAKLTYIYTPFADSVPEPATWAFMMCGFGLLGTAARRRMREAIT